MNTKLIGGILLILGTCIGAGLLALPIITAHIGFGVSVLLFVIIWLAMTAGALLLLEVNLWLPERANLVSMAEATLGRRGALFTWISYLLLLYSLMCAYIATNSDIVAGFLLDLHVVVPHWLSAVLIVAVLGYVVFLGIYSVDLVNRGLMLVKIVTYVGLILAIAPQVKLPHLMHFNPHVHISTIMLIVTSFGYAIILPSLRSYFSSDVKMLRYAILIGSSIPLVFYISWIAVVQGVIPLRGHSGLFAMLTSEHSVSDLTNAISLALNKTWITSLVDTFVIVCAMTSFLGVSLALSDFLADGLHIPKQGYKALLIFVATFLPPLVIVLLWPGIFIQALSYAGIFVIVILMLLPALMAFSGRYIKKLAREDSYKVMLHKYVIAALIVFGAGLIVWGVI